MAAAEVPNNNNRKNSNVSEVSEPGNDDILQQLSSDYTEYMKIDIKKESTEFEDSLEEMLTRLDEFCGLVDMIRSDTNLCLDRTLPTIHRKCLEMEKMFEKIDQLEAFVRVVSQDVAQVEKQVEQAEDEMGSLSGIKKVFKSFPSFFSKKSPSAATPSASGRTRYIPPQIFRTDIYLHTDAPGPGGASSSMTHTGGASSSMPHKPAIPAATSSERLTGSSGSTSSADKHGVSSGSGPSEISSHSGADAPPTSENQLMNCSGSSSDHKQAHDKLGAAEISNCDSVESKENSAKDTSDQSEPPKDAEDKSSSTVEA